jgi:tRNA(adenine34) deaminase
MTQTRDEKFMREALRLAREAEAAGEVPVGAVVIVGDEIIARAFNRPIGLHDPTAHAEMLALRGAAAESVNYRLSEAEMFVTLEPCVMCAGALVHARVGRLVFGARDLRFGGVRSKFQLADSDKLNHQLVVVEGVLAADCVALLGNFFRGRR